jgi:hypothetical protein
LISKIAAIDISLYAHCKTKFLSTLLFTFYLFRKGKKGKGKLDAILFFRKEKNFSQVRKIKFAGKTFFSLTTSLHVF